MQALDTITGNGWGPLHLHAFSRCLLALTAEMPAKSKTTPKLHFDQAPPGHQDSSRSLSGASKDKLA
jgi:hypothetical protein